MIKKLLFITLFCASITVAAQTKNITIDWSFNSTPASNGNANSSRTIEVGDTVTWNWYSGGSHNVKSNSSSNETFESQFFTEGGTFSYTFTSVGTNEYVCSPHSSNMFGTITVVAEGVLNTKSFDLLADIKMYPNPASSKINFDFKNNDELNVKIYTLLGKEIFSNSITKTDNSISIASLAKGIYVARITSKDGESSTTKRFIKQ
jgi:plastocyanin